jgi:undecaprenyl-diphosphatase
LTEPPSHTTGTRFPLRHALALGLLHGPTELLPISSSGHTTLVPWLMRWSYAELDPGLRKSFEVALHAGTAAALLVPSLSKKDYPWRVFEGDAPKTTHDPPHPRAATRLGFFLAALGPPALCGYAFGKQVERRFGTPATIAAGLLAGSAAMGAVEIRARKSVPTRARRARLPTDRSTAFAPRSRHITRPDTRDGLALGVAQSLALIPGVSRSGATFVAARARGFSPTEADRLSWKVGLPVISGAALLEGVRLAHAKPPRELRLPLLAGAASAFASTLVSATTLGPTRRPELVPASIVYRSALALLVIRRMRDNAI